MCGIAGLLDTVAARVADRARLERMSAQMVHRGPDGAGVFAAEGVGLAHRRLSIVDLGSGQQPMTDTAGDMTIVFNGEIYNFRELRRQLAEAGGRFATQSDTEVILQAWKVWGPACLSRLTGMFAFALWDHRQCRLWLARDPVGEKPLYFAHTRNGWLAFASELPALLAGMEEPPSLRADAVADYFGYGYVPDPKSIFEGVHKLPPGHLLSMRMGANEQPAPARYWQWDSEPAGVMAAEQAPAELARRFGDAVSQRMHSDVPLGAFLSGGVDSSGVVAAMAERSAQPIRTCAMGFADARFDESPHARAVADRFSTDHHCERVQPDAIGLVDRIARGFGEPFADGSALPTYKVAGLARQRVTVALSGDGGDELFAGYRRYPFFLREEAVKQRLPAWMRRSVFGTLAAIYPKADWAPRPLRAKATLEALAADRATGYFRAVAILPEPLRARLLSHDFRHALGGYSPVSVVEQHFAAADTDDPLRAAQYVDMQTWLAGRMLVKVDRMSMANSLEVRAPLLDPALAQWALALPPAMKLRGFEGKWLLKKALEPKLPREILYRRKQGFSMPLAHWLRHGFGDRLNALTDGQGPLLSSGMFNAAFVRQLVTQHRQGRADYSQCLWALIMFDAFLRGHRR